jgi:tRNA-modifying protein YgfZ
MQDVPKIPSQQWQAPLGTFALPDYSVIEFEGEDWKSWLQGQITQDIKLLAPKSPISFCLCKPTGQLITLGDLHEVNGNGWMIVPAKSVPGILNRVATMVILEECSARVLDIKVWHSTLQLPSHTTLLPIERVGTPGYDHLEFEGEILPDDQFDLFRLLAGHPVFGKDTGEKTLPPELGAAFENRYIHYNKGCYTGQEVLQRIHSRGHTNRTWMIFMTDSLDHLGFEPTSVAQFSDKEWLVAGFLRHDEAISPGLRPIEKP